MLCVLQTRIYKARHPCRASLPCTLPFADPEGALRAEAEQARSVKFLRECGERSFSLPTDWLEAYGGESSSSEEDGDEEAGSSSVSDGSRCSGSESDSDDESEPETHVRERTRAIGGVVRLGPEARSCHALRRVDVGHFVFFKATCAPFLVGKVLDARVGPCDEQEVYVHWLSPFSKKLRDRASKVSIQEYGAVTFRKDYLSEVQQGTTGRSRPRRVKDTDWESISRIVASCRRLNAKGTRIPMGILRTLEGAQQEEEVEDLSAAN